MALDLTSLIRQGATQRQLDPLAVLAVAGQEGLSGGIGDAGTSFGPFQLHWGGAYPSHAPQGNPTAAQAWATSPAGVSYALDKIASVARGLTGRAAIDAIVHKFERPADPAGEAARAWASYSGGSVPRGGTSVPTSQLPSMTMPSMPSASSGVPSYNNLVGALIGSLGKSPGDQLSSVLGAIGLPSGTPTAMPMPSVSPLPFTGPAPPVTTLPNTGGGVAGQPVPFKGQLLGMPGSGTHSWTEGPNNWESDNAIDVPLPYGTPIRAVADGVIGSEFGPLNSSNPRMAGLRLHLNTKGNEYYYAHLSRFAPGLKPGSRVKAGQIIGWSGAANGVNHLHFGQERGNPAALYG